MKRRIYKVLSIIVVFSVIASMFSVTAFAETFNYNRKDFEVRTEGPFKYVILDKGSLTDGDREYGEGAYITGYTGTQPNIVIPNTLGGQPVVYVGSKSFKDNTAIQALTVNSSVKSICSEAFMNCKGLQTVLIASNTEMIGDSAFSGCPGLKSVTFQNGSQLKYISHYAFLNCTSLNNFVIPDGTEVVGDGAFCNCNSLVSIDIPDSVTTLGAAAFFGCDSLRSAVIGNGVTGLYTLDDGSWSGSGENWGSSAKFDGAFEGCVALTSVTFGKSIKSIGQDCFAGCALTEVVIPDEVEATIGVGAFMNCYANKKVVIGNGISKIFNRAFLNNTALESISTGDGVTEIEYSAFENCHALTSVDIGKNVLNIGEITFRNCDSLKDVTIPTNVTYLGGAAFFSCDSLENVVIGNGLTDLYSMDDGSWSGSGENWGSSAKFDGIFEGCVNLKTVKLGSALKNIGRDSFAGSGLPSIDIPDNVLMIDIGALQNCQSLTKVNIGDGVTDILRNAFYNDDALTDVKIGSGVVSIGDSAFYDCDAIKTIYIPSNVTKLGNIMFFHCDSLEKVVIGNGVTDLYALDDGSWSGSGENWGSSAKFDGMFEGCVSLDAVTLGSGLVEIGQDTFAGTQIKTLTVPAKVSTLGDGAFASASLLKDIYFTGNFAPVVGKDICKGMPTDYTLYYIAGNSGYGDLAYNKAAFSPITVKFDNNDPDVFAAPTEDQIMSPLGGYVIEPISPTAFGYLFEGWYKDSACTQKFNFNTERISKNTTLYAKWESVDTVVPVRPENVSSPEKSGNSVTLQWSAVDGAVSYNVYMNGVKKNTEPIGTTNFTVMGLEPATTYEFEIAAVNGIGESEKSLIFAERTSEHIHDYTEEVTTEATCTAEGIKTFTCSECGESYTEAIPMLDHIEGDWEVVTPAEVGREGLEQKKCTVCGEVLDERTIDALVHEHDYVGKVTKEPTCTEDGVRTFTCTGCDDSYTESIPAKGHTPGAWEVVTPAEVGKEGLEQKKCTVCGEVLDERTIDALVHEHDYVEKVTKEPTCTENGVRTFTCTGCDDSYTESIPAKGHTPGAWKVVTPAEVGKEGLEQKKCTVCGEVLDSRAIPAIEQPTVPSVSLGDVDGDGRINSADARMVLRYAARLTTFDARQTSASDLNADGRINSFDARIILRIAARLDDIKNYQ